MSVLAVHEVEVGIRGQRITVRGSCPPDAENRYGREQEMDLDLPLARELLRLLTAAIPLAEQAKPGAAIVGLGQKEPAA